jgi:hypothetical protein
LVDSSKALLKDFALFGGFALGVFLVIKIPDNVSANLMIEGTFETGFGVLDRQSEFEYDFVFVVKDRGAGEALSGEVNLNIIFEPDLL